VISFPKIRRSAAPHPPTEPLPLTMAAAGQTLQLVRIAAEAGLRRRLTEMGLTPGVEFALLQDRGGPLLLNVRNTRLAIGRGAAQKIIVQAAGG